MSLPNTLEQNGKLEDFPAVELLTEAAAAGLGGTFRFEFELQKIAVYLSAGEVIYAASNARHHRLTTKLIEWNAVAEHDLVEIRNLPETELALKLVESGKLTSDVMRAYRQQYIMEILMTALEWTIGVWNFNPLVRIKEDLRVQLDLPRILVKASRKLPADYVFERLQKQESLFSLTPDAMPTSDLSPEEAYVLSRFDGAMDAETTAMICGLPFEKVSRILYSLWMSGLITRNNYQPAFNEAIISQIRSAKIVLTQTNLNSKTAASNGKPPEASKTEAEMPPAPPAEEISEEINVEEQVEAFLQRVDGATSYYEILGVANISGASEIKRAYFKLAKQFHPDKFHSVGGTMHARLQNAFTRLAQAHETLKDTKNRELYDFKLSKLAASSKGKSEVNQFTPDEVYQSGVKELQSGNYNQAIAYLTRAAQLEPNIAEYQARLGQALAVHPKFRHQAEEKMQLAIKLDEKNSDWRILLVEYYMAIGLNKRAEGELNRLLSFHPNHPLAQELFAKLR